MTEKRQPLRRARDRWTAAKAAYRLATREMEDYDRYHVSPAVRRLEEIKGERQLRLVDDEGTYAARWRAASERLEQVQTHFDQLVAVQTSAFEWLIMLPTPWPDALAEKLQLIIEHEMWGFEDFADHLRGIYADLSKLKKAA